MKAMGARLSVWLLSITMAGLAGMCFSCWTTVAWAAITEEIPFYGTLQDTSGNNLTGTYDMVFRFYDAPVGGTLLDTSTHTAANGNPVTVTAGEFNVRLGSGIGNALDGLDFNNPPIYIGLTVGSDSEMSPREELASAPYAFNSDTLDGYDSTRLLRYDATGSITAAATETLFTIRQNGTGDILNVLDGGSEVFTILDGGSVGVGTASPQTTLHLSEPTGRTEIRLENLNGIPVYWDIRSGDGFTNNGNSFGIYGSLVGSGGGYALVMDGGGRTAIGTTTTNARFSVQTIGTNDLINLFETGGAEVFTVLENGSVGIGTTSPSRLLSVAGDTIITGALYDNSESAGASGSVLQSTGSGFAWVATSSLGFGSASFTDSGSDTFLTLGKNLLLGTTTNPSNVKLKVHGNMRLTGALRDRLDNPGNSGHVLQSTGTGVQWVATTTLGLDGGGSLLTDGGATTYLTALGDSFAVGTTTANEKLTVAGNINLDGGDYISINSIPFFRGSTTAGNIQIGESAGQTFNALNSYNVAIGYKAGQFASTTNSDRNVMLGYQAGQGNAGYQNLFFGWSAGAKNTGGENVIFGQLAGEQNTGSENFIMGNSAGQLNSGSNNEIFGNSAGRNNTGSYNTMIGLAAGQFNSNDENVLIGYGAGGSNSGLTNVLIGKFAGESNTGDYTVSLGYQAGEGASGIGGVFVGQAAGANSKGDGNVMLGQYTAWRSTGAKNIVIGSESARWLHATNSVVIGAEAFSSLDLGGFPDFDAVNNTVLGYRAGYTARANADNNILIGYQAADNLTTGANNVVIGYDVDLPSATGDNQLVIGNLIFGTGINGTGTTISNGKVGIGTSTPSQLLTVAGNLEVSNDVNVGSVLRITSTGAFKAKNGTVDSPSYQFSSDTDTGLYRLGINTLGLTTGGVDRLVIDNTGDVGIGTTSPDYLLHVAGTAGFDSAVTLTGNAANLVLGSNWLSGDGTDEGIFIDGLGQVGIGTSSPQTTLHVSDTGPLTTLRLENLNGGDAFWDIIAGDNVTHGNESGFAIWGDQIGAGGDYALVIDSSGDIGIGTTSPTSQLHTTGSVRFSNFGAGTLTTDAAGNLSVSSDERLKNISGAYTAGVQALLAIDPITYHWNEVSGLETATEYIGFSAQNVASVIPSAVGEDNRGFLTLSDRGILATVVNAIKELWENLSRDQQRITELEARIKTLEAALEITPEPVQTEVDRQKEPRTEETATTTPPHSSSTIPIEPEDDLPIETQASSTIVTEPMDPLPETVESPELAPTDAELPDSEESDNSQSTITSELPVSPEPDSTTENPQLSE